MKHLMLGIMLTCSFGALANGQSGSVSGLDMHAKKRLAAEVVASEKQAVAEQARMRHQARMEEERAMHKPKVPLNRRYSLQ